MINIADRASILKNIAKFTEFALKRPEILKNNWCLVNRKIVYQAKISKIFMVKLYHFANITWKENHVRNYQSSILFGIWMIFSMCLESPYDDCKFGVKIIPSINRQNFTLFFVLTVEKHLDLWRKLPYFCDYYFVLRIDWL